MHRPGGDVIDSSVRESDMWLRSMMRHLGTEDRDVAWIALRATLHAVRDEVGPEFAVRVGSRLPIPLRGLYYEDWETVPIPEEHPQPPFLVRLWERIPGDSGIIPEVAARATAAVMREHLTPLRPCE